MKRRDFIVGAAAGAMSALLRTGRAQSTAPGSVRVTIAPDKVLGPIPADFVGLGYEISSVAEPRLLSANNRKLIQFVRTLGAQGGIRVGGDTSDWAHWSAEGKAVSSPKETVVNQAAIRDLGGFLHQIGWKLIWGLNLGSGSMDEAADEAQAVAAGAGDALDAFEIGNEPDLFAPRHRDRGYGYAEFLREYRQYKQAIRTRLPNAPFAGPDAAVKTDWVEQFAKDEGGDLKLLTHHHYSQGPPRNPSTTIENLLAPRPAFEKMLARLRAASAAARVPYRFCEVNSCFGGGKAGVSDTFASALWVLDLMHTLAAYDCAGINIETGVNQLGFVSHYSPIYPAAEGGFIARPIYYGMLAFAQSARGRRIAVERNPVMANLKVYATIGPDDRIRLTLINKDLTQAVTARVRCPHRGGTVAVSRLLAPSVSSKTEVTFAGATVDSGGRWNAAHREQIRTSGQEFDVDVPAASAAVVEM